MEKKLHEKKISEFARMEDDHSLMLRSEVTSRSGYGNTERDFDERGDKERFCSIYDLKQWAIAIVKEYASKYNINLRYKYWDIGSVVIKGSSKYRKYHEEREDVKFLIGFLIDRFEIKTEDLK